MSKLVGAVKRRTQVAEATWAFHLGVDGTALAYRPGQTIDVTLPSPPYQDAAGNRRTFSLAAAPGRREVLIATRVRGSAFKRSLLEGPPEMPVEIEGPFGSFTLPNRPGRIVMLAGGIGVTPFRSMVEDAITRRLEHSLLLVHSNRTPEEAPFLDELREWSGANPSFRYLPTMTKAESSRAPWMGERRRVGAELLAEALSADRDAALYYAAGPDRFVKGAVESLRALGVDEDRIRFEEFAGY